MRENARRLQIPMCLPAQKADYRWIWLVEALKPLKLDDI